MVKIREFDQIYVIKQIEINYHISFPERKFKSIILSYGFRNDKTGNTTSMFFCFDHNHESIGFAIYYGSKKFLRFYNHEGEDMGLEINMEFKSIKKGKVIKRN